MKQSLKILFLVVTLAIPLSIFIFLRIFGENKFDIPVLHAAGVEQHFANCNFGSGQFHVPEDIVSSGGPSLIFIYEDAGFDLAHLDNQYSRLRSLFKTDLADLKVYTADSILLDHADVVQLDEEQLKQVMNCGLVTNTPNQFILIDEDRRIRGYYDTDLDEIDRLIVEIKILLQNGTGE